MSGGGGGASFLIAGAELIHTEATNTGDGQVTITYDPETDSCTPPTTSPDDDDHNECETTTTTAPPTSAAATPTIAVVAEASFTG
jgi:hypothetical protein